MTEEEIFERALRGRNVLIIGAPESGKTYLANILTGFGHKIIHTDDYREWGFAQAMLQALTAVQFANGRSIVEGVLGYRMLRKGVEFGSYYPDLVIEIKAPMLAKHRAMDKANQTVLAEYFSMQNEKHKPEWIEYDRY